MKSTTVSKFQAAMAAEVEADEPKRLDIFVNDEDTVQTVADQIRVRAEDNGLSPTPEEVGDIAVSIIETRDGADDSGLSPLAALAEKMARNRSTNPDSGDAFEGMELDVDPADAFGLVQANVTAWLEEHGRWATSIEISHKADQLVKAAQNARPGPVTATYTVGPDGLVADYEIGAAERELPGMPGHPEAPNAEPVEPSMLWDPAVWGKAVNAADKATQLWAIPQNREFTNGQLKRAIDLDEMVDVLIRTVRPLTTLAPLVIGWYWKSKGGRSHGKPILSRVAPADKTLAYERQCDVVVHLSADHLRKMKASALFVERLVFDALARIDPAGPRVAPDDEWSRLPGRWRYGWLGPDERLYADLVSQIDGGHEDDTTRDPDAVTVVEAGLGGDYDIDPMFGDDLAHPENYPDPDPMPADGVLVHDDGTPLTAEEIAEQEQAELRDDPAEDDD